MKRRGLSLILVLAMLLALAAGCGSINTNNTSSNSETSGNNESAESEGNAAGETSGEVKLGGTLRVYLSADLTSLDHTRTRISETVPFYETILYKDKEGNYKGQLVESFESDVETMTYTFHMKDEPIYFHDGSLLTSEVLAWNINQYKEVGYFASSFNKIDYAEAVDESTFVIHMSEWDMLIPNCLARMCHIVSMEYVETNGWDSLAETECGTGPFMLKAWNRGENLQCEKFTQYYGGEPRLDEVHYIIYASPDVAIMALENGELDVVDFSKISYSYLPTLAENEDIVIYDAASGGHAITLGFECVNKDDPLYDVNVRKAICHAIDNDAIGEALTEGYFYSGSTQWSVNEYVYCSDKVTGFEYDIELAKEMLAEAGYPDGFSTTLIVQAAYEDAAVFVQAMLQQVGIECEVQSLDRANFDKYISGWGSGMLIHSVGVSNGQEYQITNSARSDVTTGYGSASFKHTDELDELCDQAMTSALEDSYAPIQRVAEIMFQEDVDMNVLYLTQGIMVASSSVKEAGICERGSRGMSSLHLAWLDK